MITGVDAFEKAISGIKMAVEANLNPVKVNTVLLKGINDNEVWNIADFAKRNSVILQLIELESAREDKLYRKYHSCMHARAHVEATRRHKSNSDPLKSFSNIVL